jgi:hypothetical protein
MLKFFLLRIFKMAKESVKKILKAKPDVPFWLNVYDDP